MLEQSVDVRPHSRLRWAVIALLAAAVLVPVRLSARPDRPATEQRAKSAVVSHPDDAAYVFLLDESTVIMSGNMQDVDRARQLRESGDDELLWMRRGDQEYVVRDRSVLEPIRQLHASPGTSHRDAREEELARREEELAREQDLLSSEQDALSGHADALSRERELLEERVRGQADEEVRGRVEKLAQEQRHMEAQAVDREREMARLEAMIGELAAEQDRAAAGEDTELQQRIRAILDEAVRSGKARRVRPAI